MFGHDAYGNERQGNETTAEEIGEEREKKREMTSQRKIAIEEIQKNKKKV